MNNKALLIFLAGWLLRSSLHTTGTGIEDRAITAFYVIGGVLLLFWGLKP